MAMCSAAVTTPRSGDRWLRSLCAFAVVVAASAIGHGSARAQDGSGDAPSARSAEGIRTLWIGQYWTVRGADFERGRGWMVVDDAVASRPGAGPSWDVRADRLVAWIAGPHQIGAWLASGRVRVLGARPMYVMGSQAASFRPGAGVTVTGRSSGASLVGSDWRVAGRRIEVDFTDRSATIVGLGTDRSR